VTYYCCMKQGIRLIDKTNGKQSEINFNYILNLIVRMKAVCYLDRGIEDA